MWKTHFHFLEICVVFLRHLHKMKLYSALICTETEFSLIFTHKKNFVQITLIEVFVGWHFLPRFLYFLILLKSCDQQLGEIQIYDANFGGCSINFDSTITLFKNCINTCMILSFLIQNSALFCVHLQFGLTRSGTKLFSTEQKKNLWKSLRTNIDCDWQLFNQSYNIITIIKCFFSAAVEITLKVFINSASQIIDVNSFFNVSHFSIK